MMCARLTPEVVMRIATKWESPGMETKKNDGACRTTALMRGATAKAAGVVLGWSALWLVAASPVHAAGPVAPRDLITLLQRAGYSEIRDVEYDDGLWEVEVRRAYGLWDEISVDPDTGEIFDMRGNRPVLTMRELLARLERQGYRDITDIERDAGVWEVEASDARGHRLDLKVSGHDGRVLHSKFDD